MYATQRPSGEKAVSRSEAGVRRISRDEPSSTERTHMSSSVSCVELLNAMYFPSGDQAVRNFEPGPGSGPGPDGGAGDPERAARATTRSSSPPARDFS